MFQQLVVPVDGSAVSWHAVPVAARMAAAVDGKLEVVTVVDRLADVTAAQRSLHEGIEQLEALAVEPMYQVLASDSVAVAISDHLETLTGGMVVMSSHGHGRSAAVLGSVTDELLRRTYGPIIVVGPHASPTAGALDGRVRRAARRFAARRGDPADRRCLDGRVRWHAVGDRGARHDRRADGRRVRVGVRRPGGPRHAVADRPRRSSSRRCTASARRG